MRRAASDALLSYGIAALAAGSAPASVAVDVLCAVMGLLLLAGLWTPIVATLAAIEAAWLGFSNPAEAGFYLLLATLAAAPVLVEPGARSVDARLFGWRRREIPADRGDSKGKRDEPPPLVRVLADAFEWAPRPLPWSHRAPFEPQIATNRGSRTVAH
jgi:hypothetical protein